MKTTLARTLLACSMALAAVMQPATAQPLPDAAQTRRLHALFDERWEALMKLNPEWGTYLGDHRYGDRLHDASLATEAAEFAAARRYLMQLQALPRDALSASDRTSREIAMQRVQDQLRFEPFVGYRRLSLGAIDGFQSDFANLLDASPVAQRTQVEQMLARMAAYPQRVEQELIRLREGLALGWVPPRAVQERVLAVIDGQLPALIDKSPFFEPFTKLGKEIPAAEQQALQERARRSIAGLVQPALRRLRDFVAGDYMAAARSGGALADYPGGAAVYAALVQSHTTTDLSPAQVHAIGEREVSRLRGEIDAVMRDMAWQGDFASFVKHLNTDPKYFHAGPEALLASYRNIAKQLDAELPKLFAELPRAPYGVKAMPAHLGPDRAEYYQPPALDGSTPGWFFANAQAWRTRPMWGDETLIAHEAVPGHHLQNARAGELGELPKFRRAIWYTAYGEGWALYAETLGFDLGLYKNPASRFGHLQWQMVRAVRLMVDTGLHAQGWSRQRAIDFMIAQTGMDPAFVSSEVDRYTSWPGQALGYMIGQLKIIELRDHAKRRLGERFDIRRFHMVVLDSGAVPLTVLERHVDEWIAALAAAPTGRQ